MLVSDAPAQPPLGWYKGDLPLPRQAVVALLDRVVSSGLQMLSLQAAARQSEQSHMQLRWRPAATSAAPCTSIPARRSGCLPPPAMDCKVPCSSLDAPHVGIQLLRPVLLGNPVLPDHLVQRERHGCSHGARLVNENTQQP
jgi:hypothetical protein